MKQTKFETEEDIKCYLHSISIADKYINIKLEELSSLRKLSKNTNMINNYKGAKTSTRGSKTENTVIKIMKLEEDCNELINEYVDLKLEVNNVLEQMNDIERMLLELRYIKGMTWGQIAKQTCYSRRQLTRLHNKALKSFKKIKDVPQCPI